jgi:hypothetical protein
MKLTSNGPRRVATVIAAEDGFEELRSEFFERLKAERLRFLILHAALAQGETERAAVLQELRSRAHRLSGTAAIFEVTGVAVLSRALELAVDAAAALGSAAPRAENSDRVMCATLLALIRVIGSLRSPEVPAKTARLLQIRGQVGGRRRAKATLNG